MFTSYYGNINNLVGEKLVSISTSMPSYLYNSDFNIIRYEKLYPGWDLVNAIKSKEIDWIEYERIYRDTVLSKLKARHVYMELGHNSILLCYEKPGDNCHRRIVSKWLEENIRGIEVKEWGNLNSIHRRV